MLRIVIIFGSGSSVGIATGYGLDDPGSKSGGGEILPTCPDRPWGPPSLLYNGYRVFPGGKERPGRDADLSPLLVSWSWKGRAIPLLPLWAVRPVHGVQLFHNIHRKRRQTLQECRTGLTFRHRASCILGQAFRYFPENAFYIFNQKIYFIIWYLLDRASLI